MSMMLSYLKAYAATLRKDDEGATMIEYGLLAALIAVVVIAAVTLIGTNLQDRFDDVGQALQ